MIYGDDESEVFDRVNLEVTFCWFEEQVIIQKDLHYTGGDLSVFFHGFCEYQDVVHVYGDDLCDYKIMKDHIHHGLERHQRVAESEEHDEAFIQTIFG